MYTYLVRAPCRWPCFDQSSIAVTLLRVSLKPFKDFEMRLRRFPVFVIHHCAVLVSHIRAQRIPLRFLIPLWSPLDDPAIHRFWLMFLQWRVERAVSRCIASEDHHSASEPIQPMANPYLSVFLFPYR